MTQHPVRGPPPARYTHDYQYPDTVLQPPCTQSIESRIYELLQSFRDECFRSTGPATIEENRKAVSALTYVASFPSVQLYSKYHIREHRVHDSLETRRNAEDGRAL